MNLELSQREVGEYIDFLKDPFALAHWTPENPIPIQSVPQYAISPYWREVWTEGQDALNLAANYEPQAFCIPPEADDLVGGRATFDGRVTVLPESILWGIGASSDEAAGFKLQIQDLGTKANLFSQPINFSNASGGDGTVLNIANRLWLLERPLMITEPGLLSVRVTNLATVPNALQVVLYVAAPKWGRTLRDRP